MKKTLLSAALLATAFGYSQTNLVLNGTADEFQIETGDNADAWDMTPNSQVQLDSSPIDPATGEPIFTDSPYRAIWNNTALGSYMEDTFNGGNGVDEQPGSTSGGNDGRGIKLSNDGNPIPLNTGVTTRRMYQKVEAGITASTDYIFSLDSKRDIGNSTATEVFILNEEITTEVGLDDPSTDSRVIASMEISNDSDVWATNTLPFTTSATDSFVVIYIRNLGADNNGGDDTAVPAILSTDAFYDNLSLVEDTALSNNDFVINGDAVTASPVPMLETLNIGGIEAESTVVRAMNGAIVAVGDQTVDVAGLASAMYILEVTANGKTVSTMVVK